MSKKNVTLPTEEELKQREEEIKKEVDEVNKKLNDLHSKLQDEKYSGQVYGENSQVNIPGNLFSTFANSIESVFEIYTTVKRNLELTIRGIEMHEIKLSKMQIALMEQHIKNIDEGNSISSEEMDKQDAKKVVKTKKEK